jgi:hypothetical protein
VVSRMPNGRFWRVPNHSSGPWSRKRLAGFVFAFGNRLNGRDGREAANANRSNGTLIPNYAHLHEGLASLSALKPAQFLCLLDFDQTFGLNCEIHAWFARRSPHYGQ